MSSGKMTETRLHEILLAYGAEPSAWPEDEREAARALLASAPERFAGDLAGAGGLDRLLRDDPVPDFAPDLAARILEAAPNRARHFGWGTFWPQRFRLPAGAVLGSVVVGLVSGYAYAAVQPAPTYEGADMVYDGVFGSDELPVWLEEAAE